jgi:hypothetical protein
MLVWITVYPYPDQIMAVLVSELVFKAIADMTAFDQAIDRSVKGLNEKMGGTKDPYAGIASKRDAAEKNIRPIKPEFDFSEVHEFNTLIDIKIAHWGKLRREVEENPISPAIGGFRGNLVEIREELLLLDKLRAEYEKPMILSVETRSIVTSHPQQKQMETGGFLPVESSDQEESTKKRKTRDSYYSTSAQPEKKIIKEMGRDLGAVLETGTKKGVEAGMEKFIKKMEKAIPNSFETVTNAVIATTAGQLTNSFLQHTGINEKVEERIKYARSVADEIAPQITEPIKQKAGIVKDGIRRFAGRVGIDTIETFENEKSTPTEKGKSISESFKKAYEIESAKVSSELAALNQDFDIKPVAKAILSPTLEGIDGTLRQNRMKSLEDDAIPLVLQRASAIIEKQKAAEQAAAENAKKKGTNIDEAVKAAGKKKNTGLVADENTDRLVIAAGGYAGARGLSGMRLPKLINQDSDDKTKAISIVNKDNDASDAFLKVDAELYHGVMGVAAGLKKSTVPFMKQLGEIVEKSHSILEMKPVSKIASLAKPNLRGYSNDAVEMSAQALVALEKNPTIKIELIGESGGGFVAEEAAQILQMLGHGDRVNYVGAGTPDLIGGLNPSNGSKVLSPSEPLGYLNTSALLPLGFSKSSESQQVAGFYSHAFDQEGAYHENQLAEYQNAVKGKPGRMSEKAIAEMREGISQIDKMNVSDQTPQMQLALQQKLMSALQKVRRHSITAEPDQQSDLNKLVGEVENQFIRFSPETDEMSAMRYGLELARGVLDQHKQNPSIASSLEGKSQLTGLKEAHSILKNTAKKDAKNSFGTEESKKYNQLELEFKRLISEFSNLSTLPATQFFDEWGSTKEQKQIKNPQSLYQASQLEDPWKDLEVEKKGVFVDPAQFKPDLESQKVTEGENNLRQYQIQYIHELSSRAASLALDINRLMNSGFPPSMNQPTSVPTIGIQEQRELPVTQKAVVNPASIPQSVAAVNPIAPPKAGTLGEITGIRDLTDEYQLSASKQYQQFASSAKPISTIKGAKAINSAGINEIAQLYVGVKEASIRAIQGLEIQAARLQEIIESSNDSIVVAMAKSAKIKVNQTKGQITKYATSTVLAGSDDKDSLAAAERNSLIGKTVGQNSKLQKENPEANKQLLAEIARLESHRSRVDVYAPDEATQNVAAKIDKPILSATAQRIKNRKLGGKDADIANDEGFGQLDVISFGVTAVLRDLGGAIAGAYKKVVLARVYAKDAKVNAKQFATKGYPYAPAQQMPRLPDVPQDQDPLYNEVWGKYYDDQIAGKKPKKPPLKDRHIFDFVAAGLTPEERKAEMVRHHQDGFLERLNDEALGDTPTAKSSFFGFFSEKGKGTTKSQDLTTPQKPKIDSIFSDFPEQLQEQQINAFHSAIQRKTNKSNKNDAGFGLPIQAFVSKINDNVADSLNFIELKVQKSFTNANKVFKKAKALSSEGDISAEVLRVIPGSNEKISDSFVKSAKGGNLLSQSLSGLGAVNEVAESRLGKFYNTLKIIGGVVIGLIAGGGIIQLAQMFIKFADAGTAAARSMELVQLQSVAAAGSASKGSQLIERADIYASKNGYSLAASRSSLIATTAELQGQSDQSAVSNLIGQSSLKAASSRGLGEDQAAKISLILAKASKQNEVSSIELASQLTEAGLLDANSVVARATNNSVLGVNKFEKSGQLDKSAILRISSTLGSDSDAQGGRGEKTINQAFQGLNNSNTKFLESFGQGTKDILPIVELLSKAIDFLTSSLSAIGAVVNGAMLYGVAQIGIVFVKSALQANMAASVFGATVNIVKSLSVALFNTVAPILLITAGLESVFSIVRNLKGVTVFDDLASDIKKNIAAIKEAANEVKGLKGNKDDPGENKKDADKVLSGNWFDQTLDFARKGLNAGVRLSGTITGDKTTPGLNGNKNLLYTQRELNEDLGRSKLNTEIIPSIKPAIEEANSVLADETRLKQLASLREKLAQNQVAQGKVDETDQGKRQYDQLKKEQAQLEASKINVEKPFVKTESNLESLKKQLQSTVDQNAFPEKRKELNSLIDQISVTQSGFKKVASAVSETTRAFGRITDKLARYDRALEQSKGRISIKGSEETIGLYKNRREADHDRDLVRGVSDQAISNDERNLSAIQDDLARRKVEVTAMRKLVGSDTIDLDPIKDKKKYEEVEKLTKAAVKLKTDAAKLIKKGDTESVAASFDKESKALRIEQEISAIKQSKPNLIYDAEKLAAVKSQEDKVLQLMQEAADKSAQITKAKVEKEIALEKEAVEEIEFYYQQAIIKQGILATNEQSELVPIRKFESKTEFGEREAAVNVKIAGRNYGREVENKKALQKLIDDEDVSLTGEDVESKILAADQKVAEARKALLEAEKGQILAATASTVRQIELAQARIEGITQKLERDTAIAASKASRAAISPVNLKQSFLAIDISDTVQKLQTLKNEAAALDTNKQVLSIRKDSLSKTLSPEAYQELQGAFQAKPENADVAQLSVVKAYLEGQKDQTPESASQLNYVKERLEIGRSEVDLEAKKTSLASSINQAQKDVQSKMKEVYNAQVQLTGTIIADNTALTDELRKTAAEIKQGSATNKVRRSLLGITGFMSDFADGILALIDAATAIGNDQQERGVQAVRSKGKYNQQLDQNKQAAAQVIAESKPVFDTTYGISGGVDGVGTGGQPTLYDRHVGNGELKFEGPTQEFTGQQPGVFTNPNIGFAQKTSTGYQINPNGDAARSTVIQRTGTSEPVRTFGANGEALITSVSRSLAENTKLLTAAEKKKYELDVVKFEAALIAFDNTAIKIKRDLAETVRGAQTTTIANSFTDRELQRSSRRSNYVDQAEATKDETIKNFLADQKTTDDEIRQLELMLSKAADVPAALEKALAGGEGIFGTNAGEIKSRIASFGDDTEAGKKALLEAVAARKTRRGTLGSLYQNKGLFAQQELRDAQVEKIDQIQSNSQTGYLREKAGVEGTDKYEAARLTGQAALIENEASFKKGLRDLQKELASTNLAGTTAGNAIEANFKRINEIKLDKIRNEINVMTGQISSALTGEFTTAILSVGDAFSKAFERLTNPERFKNVQGGIRGLGDSLIDTLKALGQGILGTLAKISAEAAAASISKWATKGLTGFMNGILGISVDPAAKDTPVMPPVDVAPAKMEIPQAVQSQPMAILDIHKADAAVDAAKQKLSSTAENLTAVSESISLPSEAAKPSTKTPVTFADQIARQQEEGLPAFKPVEPVNRPVYVPPVILPVGKTEVVPEPVVPPKSWRSPLVEMDFGTQAKEPVYVPPIQKIEASPGSGISVDPGTNVKDWVVPPPDKLTEAGQIIGEGIVKKLQESQIRTDEILAPLPTGQDLGSNIGAGQSFVIEKPVESGLKDTEKVSKVNIVAGGEVLGEGIAKSLASSVATTAAKGGNIGQSIANQGVSIASNYVSKGVNNLLTDGLKAVFGFDEGGMAGDRGQPIEVFAQGGMAGYSAKQIERAMAEEGEGAMLGVVHRGEIMVSRKTGDAAILNSLIQDGTWAERKANRSAAVYATGGTAGGSSGMPNGGGSRSSTSATSIGNVDNSTTINIHGMSDLGRDQIGYSQDQLELRQQRAAARNQYRSR